MKIDYFTIDGAPGKYFMCGPYKASMSVSSCASMYRAEKGVHAGRHMHCRGCPIGAFHAGEKPVASRGLFGSLICPRCQRGASRLVTGVCVSCVNRQYEVVRGVNAKGRAPVRLLPLAPMEMALREDSRIVVAMVPLSSSRVEVILRALRSRPGVRAFGRRASSRRFIDQLSGGLFSTVRIRL